MRSFRISLLLIALVAACLAAPSVTHADSNGPLYIRFASSSVTIAPGTAPRVIVQYGSTSNFTLNVEQLVCNLNPRYGDFASVYKGYFKQSFEDAAKQVYMLSEVFKDHGLAPHQSTSISFNIDTAKAVQSNDTDTTLYCYIVTYDGIMASATLPINGAPIGGYVAPGPNGP